MDELVQSMLIVLREVSEDFAHQALLEDSEHGLDDRGLKEPGGLPVAHVGLAECRR